MNDSDRRIPEIRAAEAVLSTSDLAADLEFLTGTLGFRLDTIFPADDPAVATLSGHGVRLRLDRAAAHGRGVVRLLCEAPGAVAGGARSLTAPGGTRIELAEAATSAVTPPTDHAFMVRRLVDGAPWVVGRAGMRYRDLIPGRLGGSIIASHIRIPDAGPVPDMVHYHTVGFQLIYCYTGWVRLVYEDQGPPFVLAANDCVIQPPEIRHRVLESSENLQVIEIGVPAEHVTTVDHEMTLPTATVRPARLFGGTTFCRSEAAAAGGRRGGFPGFEARETGIDAATKGVASVQVARPTGAVSGQVTSHASDILFTFVLSGSVTLHADGQGVHTIGEGDAFVVPPHLKNGAVWTPPTTCGCSRCRCRARSTRPCTPSNRGTRRGAATGEATAATAAPGSWPWGRDPVESADAAGRLLHALLALTLGSPSHSRREAVAPQPASPAADLGARVRTGQRHPAHRGRQHERQLRRAEEVHRAGRRLDEEVRHRADQRRQQERRWHAQGLPGMQPCSPPGSDADSRTW